MNLDTWTIVGEFSKHNAYLNLRLAFPELAMFDPIRRMVERSKERKDKRLSIIRLAWYKDEEGIAYFERKGYEIDYRLYSHCYRKSRRIPKLEQYILTSPEMAYAYTSDIPQIRNPAAEKQMIKSAYYTYKYMKNVLALHELHDFIDEGKHSSILKSSAYLYKFLIKIGSSILDPAMVVNAFLANPRPKYMYLFCLNVYEGRYLPFEPYIFRNPYWTYCYMINVVGHRLDQAEDVLLSDSSITRAYVKYMLLTKPGSITRWRKAERYLIKDPLLGIKYFAKSTLLPWLKQKFNFHSP